MTTPRDAIGLSDRLRERLGPSRTVTVSPGLYEDVSEAATALDALQARVKELEAKAAALFWSIPDDIAAQIKCGDLQKRAAELFAAESRATSAEQERDEALERLKAIIDAKALSGVRYLVAGWNGENRPEGPFKERHPDRLGATLPKTNCGAVYQLDEAMTAARDLVSRLAAGTEKEGE